MVRQAIQFVPWLMRLGTNRRIQALLAILLPIISRMKSPSIRILMTTMVPQMMATSHRHMNDQDRQAVLDRIILLVEEFQSYPDEQPAL